MTLYPILRFREYKLHVFKDTWEFLLKTDFYYHQQKHNLWTLWNNWSVDNRAISLRCSRSSYDDSDDSDISLLIYSALCLTVDILRIVTPIAGRHLRRVSNTGSMCTRAFFVNIQRAIIAVQMTTLRAAVLCVVIVINARALYSAHRRPFMVNINAFCIAQ